MISPLDPTRLRHGLSPLTTSPPAPHVANQLHSPISAVSMTSTHVHSARISGGAIQPYNPQEWVSPSASTPAHSSERSLQFESESRGDEGRPLPQLSCASPAERAPSSVLPPPPYSPPRTRRPRPVSTAFEYAMDRTLQRNTPPSMSSQNRLSVEPQQSQGFPPPPGASGRGSSRERRFGLPLLGRRRDQDQLSSSPDPQSPVLAPRRSMISSVVYPDLERIQPPTNTSLQIAPPAARRAASTGAIDTPTSAQSRSASQTRWENSAQLPPPPPGPPPPSASRSQSVQSVDRNIVPIISPPTRRPPPSGITSLGPVPPTPADWVDEETDAHRPDRGRLRGSTLDGRALPDIEHVVDHPLASPSNASLNRTRAIRHDKTIIQRRTESRNRNASPQSAIDSVARETYISDIVVTPAVKDCALIAPQSNTRNSSGSRLDYCRASEPSSSSMRYQDSKNSTPKGPGSARLPRLDTATPPFSPHFPKDNHATGTHSSVPPKSLPTPPPQTRSASSSRLDDANRSASADKSPLNNQTLSSQSPEQFCLATVERFRVFAEKEASASTDADRVRLFADFIVSESRIRRGRYSGAIGAMGSEIFDLTRDLFRPMAPSGQAPSHARGLLTPASSAGLAFSPEEDLSGVGFSANGLSNSAPPSANLLTTQSDEWQASSASRAMNYMPSLSPILSMSVSENYENGSSRGRPPSRWWESGSQGEQAHVLERSKRESKYMGVPKNQWAEEQGMSTHGLRDAAFREASHQYPSEKAGWHNGEDRSWTPGPPSKEAAMKMRELPLPSQESPRSLDVSRLVTLPPPYPRHHPAVNNNHPELAAIRSSVRVLSDLAEVEKVKKRFGLASSQRREEFAKAAAERQQSLRANLQEEVVAGNLDYADAAAIESDSTEEERSKKKELEKTEYESFQNDVVLPLNDLLTGRISRATELFNNLLQHLFDNGLLDADLPQEEGDDEPELLEKLTLLKWIFEMRETLHRAIYEILSDRNRRYREVVVAPYKLSGNIEKLRSAEAFFAEDAAKRAHAYWNEVLDRAQGFQKAMEEAVERGVALQLSAFWDIAPPLRQLLDGIPDDLTQFRVQIPTSELEENPSYGDHPLQYLYSLLQHTEKSTYQFIESHTNLLCLLHEVKEAVVNAQARVMETHIEDADGTVLDLEEREKQATTMRQSENRRLTDDLKEKVRVVQDQWNSALGDGIREVKERTGAWLVQQGGWDEALDESARPGEI